MQLCFKNVSELSIVPELPFQPGFSELEVDLISLWLCLLVYVHNSHPSFIYAAILFLLNTQFLNIIA